MGDFFLIECYKLVRDCCIVIGEANVCYVWSCVSAIKSSKLVVAEYVCHLSCTVWAEVEEDYGILILNLAYCLAVLCYYCRYNELVCNTLIVGCLNCACAALCLLALAETKCTVSLLDTIPTVISIHCVITTHNGCYLTYAKLFTLVHKCSYIFLA